MSQAHPQDPGLGIGAALPAQAPDHGLPPGVHPRDPSAAYERNPVSADTADQLWNQSRQPPWSVDNSEALAVYQRCASDWSAGLTQVGGQNNAVKVIGRQKGRQSVTLAVPTALPDGSSPNGVVVGSSEGAVQQAVNANAGGVWILNPGDSVTIYTEASVWAGPLVGQTTGWVQFVVAFNPPGGGIGGD